MTRTLSAVGAALAAVAGLLALTTTPAVARAQEPPPAATYFTTITVQSYDTAGHLIDAQTIRTPEQPLGSAQHVTAKSLGQTIRYAHGSGGPAQATGCRTLTITNNTKTALGFIAFRFITENHWCWVAATHRVYNVSVLLRTEDIDAQFQYHGLNNSFSQDIAAGKRIYRQGHFTNCVIKYGCIGNYYPSNEARLLYTGMWTWETNG
jgi:hypothetical protein